MRCAQVVACRAFNRFALALLLSCTVPLLCSFSSGKEKKKSASRHASQKTLADWEKKLRFCASRGDWHQFGDLATKAAKRGIHSGKLRKIAQKVDTPALNAAIRTSEKIRKLSPDLGISFAELVQISLFIDNELPRQIRRKGNYLSRRVTGLPRPIEYDVQSGLTFIHLKTNGTPEIGRGRKKTVTKSILYDASRPILVANCSSHIPMPKEVFALEQLQGLPGIVETKAVTERKDAKGRTVYGLFCKYYSGGDLGGFIEKNHSRLSLRSKMKIALGILKGLESMHESGFVHCDLNSRNFLIDFPRKGEVDAVIADMGRTIAVKKVKGSPVQWNPYYIAPEGLFYQKLEGKDYTYSDIYAVGCVFYKLFTGKRAPWMDIKLTRGSQGTAVKRHAQYMQGLKKCLKRRYAHLVVKNKNRFALPAKEKFERLILMMCDPVPAHRGDAQKLRTMLEAILKGRR